MTRGKYKTRADNRLRILESEKLREASETIGDLKQQLSTAKHENDTLRAEMNGKALAAARDLSQREKQHLRNQIASLEHQGREARLRYAVLAWEVIHRHVTARPAPLRLSSRDDAEPDMRESFQLWLEVHWELAAIFFDYEEAWTFFETVEGQEFRMAGDVIYGTKSGEFPVKQTARENTRALKSARHKFGGHMARRLARYAAHLDEVWAARQHGGEPVAVRVFREEVRDDHQAVPR